MNGAKGMPNEEQTLAAQMIEASRQTQAALDRLSSSLDGRREHIDSEIKALRVEMEADRVWMREEISGIAEILVGKKGDNGLATRVLLLEKQKGSVSWQSVGVLVALGLAAMGFFLT